MNIKSFFKKFFLGGALVDKVISPINGEIFVFEDFWGKWMRIGGVSQSGGLVVSIWREAINQITNHQLPITNCLILGLGAGNAAKLAAGEWPGIKIVGVELDPVVVEVGKKHFELGRIKNLEILIDDAIKAISKLAISNNYDLVLVDLYLGKQFPKEAESEEFLEGLKKILSPGGIIVFNRFNWGEYKKQADGFREKLANHFPLVWTKKTVSNLLIFASNSGSIEV